MCADKTALYLMYPTVPSILNTRANHLITSRPLLKSTTIYSSREHPTQKKYNYNQQDKYITKIINQHLGICFCSTIKNEIIHFIHDTKSNSLDDVT